MALLRGRGRRRDDQPGDAPSLDLDAVGAAVLDAAEAALGDRPGLAEGPTPVLGYGPDAHRVLLATDDRRWAGSLVARTGAPGVLGREHAWMAALGEAGFPTPDVVTDRHADGVLVFRQPPGTNLAESMLADMMAMPKLLAGFGELHARLHAVPAAAADVVEAAGRGADGRPTPVAELADKADRTGVRQSLADELAWLGEHPPEERPAVVCHGDLNPAQVYLDGDAAAAVPVNWTRARLADPHYDVAATITGFWSVPLYLDNAVYRKAFKMARDSLVSGYLAAYERSATGPPDEGALRYWQAFHVGSLATDVARLLQVGTTGFWDPVAPVVQPEGALKDLRQRFWELARA